MGSLGRQFAGRLRQAGHVQRAGDEQQAVRLGLQHLGHNGLEIGVFGRLV